MASITRNAHIALIASRSSSLRPVQIAPTFQGPRAPKLRPCRPYRVLVPAIIGNGVFDPGIDGDAPVMLTANIHRDASPPKPRYDMGLSVNCRPMKECRNPALIAPIVL